MKILALLLLLAFGSLFVAAQEYHPLIEDEKVWLEAYYIGSNICYYESVYQMRFGGDTLIDGNIYRKILKRNFSPISPGPYCPPFVASEFEIDAGVYMREDAEARQVFIWTSDNDNPDGFEVLYYDFSLEAGDTIPISSYTTQNNILTIQSVEDYTLLNGESRRKFKLEYSELSYIEGIGGEFGLFNGYLTALCCDWATLCVQQNQESIYSNGSSSWYCSWIVTSINEQPVLSASLFPNPGNGYFVFEINRADFGSADLQLNVFSITGQKIFTEPLRADRNHFQIKEGSGLYLWQLLSDGEIVQSGKLVVE
jgi:hypothetical protein